MTSSFSKGGACGATHEKDAKVWLGREAAKRGNVDYFYAGSILRSGTSRTHTHSLYVIGDSGSVDFIYSFHSIILILVTILVEGEGILVTILIEVEGTIIGRIWDSSEYYSRYLQVHSHNAA